MTTRDELANLIDENSCLDWAECADVADAILASGWMSPKDRDDCVEANKIWMKKCEELERFHRIVVEAEKELS